MDYEITSVYWILSMVQRRLTKAILSSNIYDGNTYRDITMCSSTSKTNETICRYNSLHSYATERAGAHHKLQTTKGHITKYKQ